MISTHKHIILIGFKHVGKSAIGKKLAIQLNRKFIDLDNIIKDQYQDLYQKKLTCRQIMEKHGEDFFRNLENNALKQLLQEKKAVIALGGGAAINIHNQAILKSDILIHITAPFDIVLSRILSKGIPAFIKHKKNPIEALKKLWKTREKIYQQLATLTIDNNSTLEKTLKNILNALEKLPKKLLLLHGPNLNQLGQRDPDHYGHLTLKNIEEITALEAKKRGYSLITYQSNHEGDLIDNLQHQSPHILGIMINPGALTHYSYALHDALLDTKLPVVEVHLSKISEREAWRRHSVTAPACIRTFEGKKAESYSEAVNFLINYIKNKKEKIS